MTTRLLVLPSTLVGLIAFNCLGAPGPPGKSKAPVASPQTLAELLVGSWDLITQENPPLPQRVKIRAEFTAAGEFTFRLADGFDGVQVNSGTYKLEDNIIHLTTPATDKRPIRRWTVMIQSLTHGELKSAVVGGDQKGEREQAIFKRIVTNVKAR